MGIGELFEFEKTGTIGTEQQKEKMFDKIEKIQVTCPWCPSKEQFIKTDIFEEWDMVGNQHINGDTFAKGKCTACGKPFWVHQKVPFGIGIGKIRVHRIT